MYKERQSELGLFRLDKRQLKGNIITVWTDLMEDCREDEARPSSEVQSDRTRLKHGKT